MPNEIIPFNGRFTISSPRGGHKTFQIKTAKGGNLKGSRILSLFRGTENTNDSNYEGFAFVTPSVIRLWSRFRNTDREQMAKMLTSLVNEGDNSELHQMGYRLLMEKRCRVCNRALTHPISIAEGIGPECSGRNRRAEVIDGDIEDAD